MERLQTFHEKEKTPEVQTQDIENLRNRAWTFRGFTPPHNAKKVAEEMRRGERYEYFKDEDGNIWYETTSGREWKEKIAAWERQKKKH